MNSPAQGTREKARVNPVPEGFQTVTAHLYVRDAAAAIEFYKQALGAKEVARLRVPDGRIGHAEIQIGNSRIMLSDEFPDYGGRSPETIGGSPVIMHLFVDDVDALAAQAVAAGAKVLMPVEDRFYGDRSGRFADPFGHVWIISTHIENVSAEEIERRTEAFVKQMAESASQKEESTKP